jgi:hypothetical protein
MSYSFDGSNDRMTGTFASTYADPVTLAAFIKVTAHPLATDIILTLGNSSSANEDSYALRSNSVDDEWQAIATTSTGTTGAGIASVNIDGVWAGYVGKFSHDELRDVYIQTLANTGQGTTPRAVADVLQFIRVGENLAGLLDYAGLIAECAIWNKALSDAEITSYLAGEAASGVAAANLIGYWPLNTDNATQSNLGLDAGGNLTVTGATFSADHPTITGGASTRRPRRGMLMGVGR